MGYDCVLTRCVCRCVDEGGESCGACSDCVFVFGSRVLVVNVIDVR
jgi:hypothetical protein